MKEELTREVLEALKGCKEKGDCDLCPSNDFCNRIDTFGREDLLAEQLLEEMDKPKVWDGAPEEAVKAHIKWFDKNGRYSGMNIYTREIPKTLTQKIADEIVDAINIRPNRSPIIEPMVETVLRVLEKYAAELGTTT